MPSGPCVIVRTFNSAATVGAALGDLARQTVRPEVVVVDSGSTDGTLELVQGRCDRLVRIPPGRYRPGRALNLGAAATDADVVFALSSHCRLPRRDWIEYSLSLYDDPAVAGTGGGRRGPDGQPLSGVYLQTLEDLRRAPFWGYSNHASSWRADVGREHPFSETLVTAEDKEWAQRVLAAGWRLAFHPALEVDQSHRWRQGVLSYFGRERRESHALGSYLELPPYGVRELARDWWSDTDPAKPVLRERVSPRRMAGLLGRYVGRRHSAH